MHSGEEATIVHGALPISRPGGCALKLPVGLIDKVIKTVTSSASLSHVIVGPESKDDAAVYAISDTQALVLSVDYSAPFCANPDVFGSIATANALSDIYAMGARPITALSILCAPDTIPEPVLLAVLKSATEVCATVGIPIIGGHSAESAEILFGLSVVGMCHPNRVIRNSTAKAGDKIVLTKPLGFGLYAEAATREGNAATAALAWGLGRQLNAVGADLADARIVNAMTDITGFGLLGHLYEMAHGSRLRARINSAAIPALPACRSFIDAGMTSGASLRNRASVSSVTKYSRQVPTWLKSLLAEPETNGGLLLSICPSYVGRVIEMLQLAGFQEAAVIGEFDIGEDGIEIG